MIRSLSLVNGAPPKVIWLRIGNVSTAEIEAFIRSARVKIRTFGISPEESPLVLS
jgi:predicted nuclease of predicted toxin-antitoxin system